ncbi:MAG: hypothetical protein ACHP65_04400 [Legionellales bacterium]
MDDTIMAHEKLETRNEGSAVVALNEMQMAVAASQAGAPGDLWSCVADDCITGVLGPCLDAEARFALLQSSRNFHGLFQQHHHVSALLSFVAKGHQDKVERMPSLRLLLGKADVTDYSGRTFKNISAYQYALWALDRHMVRAIENRVRNTKGCEGDLIRTALLAQHQELQNAGLSYELAAVLQPKVAAYNPQALFAAYQEFIVNYHVLSTSAHYDDIDRLWYAIGEQQRLMPAHAIQAMLMHRNSIHLTTTVKQETLQRTNLCHYMTHKDELLYPREAPGGLGFDFALLLGRAQDKMGQTVRGRLGLLLPGFVVNDLDVLKTLFAAGAAEACLAPDFPPDLDVVAASSACASP